MLIEGEDLKKNKVLLFMSLVRNATMVINNKRV